MNGDAEEGNKILRSDLGDGYKHVCLRKFQ